MFPTKLQMLHNILYFMQIKKINFELNKHISIGNIEVKYPSSEHTG